MKKLLIALVLLAGIVAVAFASFSSSKKKVTNKQAEKKEMKRECKHVCPYS